MGVSKVIKPQTLISTAKLRCMYCNISKQQRENLWFQCSKLTWQRWVPFGNEWHHCVHPFTHQHLHVTGDRAGQSRQPDWTLLVTNVLLAEGFPLPVFVVDFYIKLQFSSGSGLCLSKLWWRKIVAVSFQIQRKNILVCTRQKTFIILLWCSSDSFTSHPSVW